jgi:transposase
VSHANAALTPKARLRLARLIVEQGWSVSEAAKMFMVSWPTAKRWASRYVELGVAGMQDRSSRPHSMPGKTPEQVKRQIVSLRWRLRLGPVQIAGRLGIPASTVHAVLKRCRISRLRHLNRVTAEPIRRYEHDRPGAMIHVDVTKFGNIPDGGGHRYVGRRQGDRNRIATAERTSQPRTRGGNPLGGTSYVHTVIDDHSRVAYAEIRADEKAATATDVLRNAVAWYAARGVMIQRVLSDNGPAYLSHLWRDTCTELGITPKRTRPYRPQTNGKIERFHRTLADGWAYARLYDSDQARRDALPAWLHTYNHHRSHTALGGQPPISRLTNLMRAAGPPLRGSVVAAAGGSALNQPGQVLRPTWRSCARRLPAAGLLMGCRARCGVSTFIRLQGSAGLLSTVPLEHPPGRSEAPHAIRWGRLGRGSP